MPDGMRNASENNRKLFALIGHDAGDCKRPLVAELKVLCQAHGLSIDSLTPCDGMAFIQAVARGCQLIVVAEPQSSSMASFAATAALAGYSMTFVAGDTTRGEAVIQQMTSQQGSSASACKLLSAQPGQESLLAAAVLAPILLWEIMISPGKSGRAGPAQPVQTQDQPAPLLLPAPPAQEPADASSGQTQHFLRGAPQQDHGPDQADGQAEAAGAHSGAEDFVEPDDVAAAAKAPERRKAYERRGGPHETGVKAKPERRRKGNTEAAATNPPAAEPVAPKAEPPCTPACQQAEARPPVQEQPEIVDLISDSDNTGRREGSKDRAAAVRRSARISSLSNSDASDSEWDRPAAQRAKAWLQQCRKRQASKIEPEVPRAKRSRLSGRQGGRPGTAGVQQVEPLPKPGKAGSARAGRRRDAKPDPPMQTEAQQQEHSKSADACKEAEEASPEGSPACAPGSGSPKEQDDNEQISEAAESREAQIRAHFKQAAHRKLQEVSSPACKGGSASKACAPAEQLVQHGKDIGAVTPSQAAAHDFGPTGKEPGSAEGRSSPNFPIRNFDKVLAMFKLNASQAASRTPGKKFDWQGKGKQKMSPLEEPWDPEQPGPSDAVYRAVAEPPAALDSDDDSIDLTTPLI